MASAERVVVSLIFLFNLVFLVIFVSVIDTVYSKGVKNTAEHSVVSEKCLFAEELSKSSCNRTISSVKSSEINGTTKADNLTSTVNITSSICQVLFNISDDVCDNVESVVSTPKSNETCEILSEAVAGFDWGQIVHNMTKDKELCDEICSRNENLTHICNLLALGYRIRSTKSVVSSTKTTTTTVVTSSTKKPETDDSKAKGGVKSKETDDSKAKEDVKSKGIEKKNDSKLHEVKTTSSSSLSTTESTTSLPQTTSNSSTTLHATTKSKMNPEKVEQKVKPEEEKGGEDEVKLEVPIKADEETDAEDHDYEDAEEDDGEETNVAKESKAKDKEFSFDDTMEARPKVHPIGTFSSGYDDGDSHFFIYFLTVVGMCITMYVLFHNKQKILAIIVEGRQDRRSRRPNSNLYRKLDTNLDEVIQDNRPKNVRSMSNVIY